MLQRRDSGSAATPIFVRLMLVGAIITLAILAARTGRTFLKIRLTSISLSSFY